MLLICRPNHSLPFAKGCHRSTSVTTVSNVSRRHRHLHPQIPHPPPIPHPSKLGTTELDLSSTCHRNSRYPCPTKPSTPSSSRASTHAYRLPTRYVAELDWLFELSHISYPPPNPHRPPSNYPRSPLLRPFPGRNTSSADTGCTITIASKELPSVWAFPFRTRPRRFWRSRVSTRKAASKTLKTTSPTAENPELSLPLG